MGQLTRCLTTIAAGIVVLATMSAAHANPVAIFDTSLGSFQVELFADDAPLTVANFLHYVNDGDYDGTFIHRTVPGFVMQGGGYAFSNDSAYHILTDPPVVNEFSVTRSNLRGTIAMAMLGGNPNSATSEWFFNLADNSANLDNQNGGFTVFGRVLGNGMQAVDAIVALPRVNAGSPFETLPVLDANPTFPDDLVMVNSITVPEPATLAYAVVAAGTLAMSWSRLHTRRRYRRANRGRTKGG